MDASGTRAGAAAVTRIGEFWPLVAPRIRAYLLARGCSAEDCDDIVQTVAERVLITQLAFEGVEDLLPWCLVVARNLAVDCHRRLARTSGVAESNDVASGWSLEEAVVHRLRLERTLAALHQLSHRDRELIVDGVEEEGTVPASGRQRVARHRARGRLLRLIGPAAVTVVLGRVGRAGRGLCGSVLAGGGLAGLAVGLSIAVVLGEDVPGWSSLSPGSRTEVTPTLSARHEARAPKGHGRTAPVASASRLPSTGGSASDSAAVVVTPDRGRTLVVSGHDRRSTDDGLLCVDGLPVITHLCAGPMAPPSPAPLLKGADAPTASVVWSDSWR
jgi:hypothetical protein